MAIVQRETNVFMLIRKSVALSALIIIEGSVNLARHVLVNTFDELHVSCIYLDFAHRAQNVYGDIQSLDYLRQAHTTHLNHPHSGSLGRRHQDTVGTRTSTDPTYHQDQEEEDLGDLLDHDETWRMLSVSSVERGVIMRTTV